MDLLSIGMNVEIRRSDGRVHAAVISAIKTENRMVDVEWFENGETKGKSVDMASLFRHNPKITGLLGQTQEVPRATKSKATRKTIMVPKPVLEQAQFRSTAKKCTNHDNSELSVISEPAIEKPLKQEEPPKSETAGSLTDALTVGMHVEIPRSDGRVHAAIVSDFKNDNRMVVVEWFENGETKTKSVDAATLLQHNPTGTRGHAEYSRPVKPKPSRKTTLLPHAPLEANGRAETAKESARNGWPAPTLSPIDEPTVEIVSPPQPPLATQLVRAETAAGVAAPGPSTSSPATAKHQVVLKTEEIERNREERRAQRMAEKRKRDDLMKVVPGNPNWEFLKMIRECRAKIDFHPLRINDEVRDDRICVCVRKRPLSKKETGNNEIEVITIPEKNQLIIHQPQTKVDLTKYLENQKFRFDYAFDDTVDNEMVYHFTAQPLVQTIFDGGFATCFAYGQTGSGKTHTMGGDIEGRAQDCTKGIYALAAIDVFSYLDLPEYEDAGLYVVCSFFELYGSKAYDLLGKRAPLRILEDSKHNVQIVGLQEKVVENAGDVLKLIREGSALRTAGQTSANSNSSRSHAIFQIVLKRFDNDKVHGKFSLIDLAGNERGADTTSSDRTTRMEGAEINKSLLSLKECIRAMGMMKDYIPFRGSKLTLVLRDSFIGRKAKTCMIATISPGLVSAENTLNTLRYADRVKELGTDE